MSTANTSISDPLSVSDQARTYGKPRSKWLRDSKETIIIGTLGLFGLLTVAITIAIIWILAQESVNFFSQTIESAQGEQVRVGLADFFLDLKWAPLLGGIPRFGIWALIWSTLMVTIIAMIVALPVGLITAIWLSEYAPKKVRAVIKPVLEILAGIPTVVYGYFALTIITPYFLRWSWWPQSGGEPVNPLGFGTYNALSAGIAVGIMTLPIVTSLSEDALRSVPRRLREGGYGLGGSRFEVSLKVIFPAALSGIVAAGLLAFARAVGETMIVALAAGSTPVPLQRVVGEQGTNLAWWQRAMIPLDPTQSVQPMTGYMVQIFAGDAPAGTVEYYSAYAVGATLFLITFTLTLIGAMIRKRFRNVYQ